MKSAKLVLILTSVLVAMGLCACTEKNGNGGDKGKEESKGYAIEKYWAEDYAGPLGLHVEKDGGSNLMHLAGLPFYAAGVNCYNLFVQTFEGFTRMSAKPAEQTIEVLQEKGIPVVRFSASPYYATNYTLYENSKDEFLGMLDQIATMCDEAHIGLIPSVFWATSEVSKYCGEEYTAYNNPESKTVKHILNYTEEIVNTLKHHKCIFAWEFGNELNLGCDIPHDPITPTARGAGEVCRLFAEKCLELDPHKRMVSTGHSVMRNASWHLMTDKSWVTDTFDQYVEVTGVLTPDPMTAVSEHVYEDEREFSDLGKVNKTDQIRYAIQAANILGKAYYIGEFTGASGADEAQMKSNFNIQFARKVQLSLMWNYALKGNIEHSFRAGTTKGDLAFELIKDQNERFKEYCTK